MIDRNSVHPIKLYKRMADNLDKPVKRFEALFDKAQEKFNEKEFHSWLCFAYGALIICVAGLGSLDSLEKVLKERMDCPDCNETGFIEVNMGGGNSHKAFCECAKGRELAEADEKPREAKEYDS